MASETYKADELEKARAESARARARYEAATTKKAKREAAENLEFWTNMTAFMTNVK